MYYNTTGETGEALRRFREKASGQDVRVMDLFIQKHDALMTPCDVWAELGRQDVLTSIRRSITNLTREGYLIKTSAKTKGIFGRPCFLWKLNPEVLRIREQQLELNLGEQHVRPE